MGCFSFYVTKNLCTGEGGMITSTSAERTTRLKTLALHGLSCDAWKRFSDSGYKHYFVVEAGFKYNMMDIQAAIGLHQLKRIEANWRRRRDIWNYYNEELKELPLVLPAPTPKEIKHAYHLYTILIDKENTKISRDDFLGKMTAHNIGVGVHYMSVPEHEFYNSLYGWNVDDYQNAKRIGRQTVSIPLSAKLTDEDAYDVVKAIRLILNN